MSRRRKRDGAPLLVCTCRFNELLKDNKEAYKSFAKKIGIDPSVVFRWTYDGFMNLQNAISVAKYFECSLDYLYGRTDEYGAAPKQPELPFAVTLKAAMKERHMTDYYICLKLKRLSRSMFQGWYKGVKPEFYNLIQLADILDVTVDHLIGAE